MTPASVIPGRSRRIRNRDARQDHRVMARSRMAATATQEETDRTPPAIDGIHGVVLEAQDLAASRAFYETIFRHADGAWEGDRGSLTFRAASQRVELVRSRRPRTIAHAGLHVAYRAP